MFIRRALIWLADRPAVRKFVIGSPAARTVSRRFVAGETVADALAAARSVNDSGFSGSLDYLGENVTGEAQADAARDTYLQLLDEIRAQRLNANVSVKLTQMGLDLSSERSLERISSIADRAAGHGNFVRVDMEGSAYTERTLEMVRAVRRRFPNVGAVIQAYLYRSENDVERLLAEGARIRLCKGAYQEPPEAAWQAKSDVDANYVRLIERLLPSGIYHGIATHDRRMIRATIDFAREHNIASDAFEFQMLYGVRRDVQAELLHAGYRVRVYIPFGDQWFPYLTRRLAERPANLLFFLRTLVHG